MNTYLETAKFSRPYLARYGFRFVVGIILAFAFGASNGLFVGGFYTMIHRLDDPANIRKLAAEKVTQNAEKEPKEAKTDGATPPAFVSFKKQGQTLQKSFNSLIDPWLPYWGRPLDWKQCLGCILFLPLLASLRGFLGYGSSYLLAWAGQRITNDVKLDVFRKVSSLSLDFFHKTSTGELIARIDNDAMGLNNFLKLGLSDLIKEPVTILSMLYVMLHIDWKFTLISLIFLPLCIIPTRKVSRKVKQLARQDFGMSVGQSNITMESFQNVRITKAYGLEEAHAQTFGQIIRRSAYLQLKSVQSREMLNPIVQSLSALGISAVLLFAVWTGSTFDKISAFLVTLILFYTPFKKLSGLGAYTTQLTLSLERLMALLQMKPTVKEDPNPVSLARFSRALEFKNVSFNYGDGLVLRDISFLLPRGKKLEVGRRKRLWAKVHCSIFFSGFTIRPTASSRSMGSTSSVIASPICAPRWRW